MRPSFIDIKDYDYHLEDIRIAKFPLENRSDSKLLKYKSGTISHHSFKELPDLIPANSLLVFNNTCVIEARLKVKKDSGSEIEVFILQPAQIENAGLTLKRKGNCEWKCMVGNKKRWKEDDRLFIEKDGIKLEMLWLNRENDVVKFNYNNDHTFEEIIQKLGSLPIPPYLNRDTTSLDLQRYQTVFAENKGSVAAPTAALHFDKETYDNLRKKGIQYDFLTLHVGAGTFKPVSAGNAIDHEMHAEYILFNYAFVEKLLQYSNHIIAVGTTSLRSLESLYWFGVGLISNTLSSFNIPQYFAYEAAQDVGVKDALKAVLEWMDSHRLKILEGLSSIYIVPGYKTRMCHGIITNFHQPQSTLLLLVSALIGNDWKKVYQEALSNQYRFLSYGDSSLLFF